MKGLVLRFVLELEHSNCTEKKKVNSKEFFIPNIIRVIKSRKSKWVENVAHTADMRSLQDFCLEILMEDSYNKTNEKNKFLKFIFGIGLYMFRTVSLPIIRSLVLYTQQ